MSEGMDASSMDTKTKAALEGGRARDSINAAYKALVDAARLLSVPLHLVLLGEVEAGEYPVHLDLARGVLDNARLFAFEAERAIARGENDGRAVLAHEKAYLRDVKDKIKDIERELEIVEFALKEAANGTPAS